MADLIPSATIRPIGFARLTQDERRAMASKGGKSVPRESRAYFRDRQLAHTAACKARGVTPSPAVVNQLPLFGDDA